VVDQPELVVLAYEDIADIAVGVEYQVVEQLHVPDLLHPGRDVGGTEIPGGLEASAFDPDLYAALRPAHGSRHRRRHAVEAKRSREGIGGAFASVGVPEAQVELIADTHLLLLLLDLPEDRVGLDPVFLEEELLRVVDARFDRRLAHDAGGPEELHEPVITAERQGGAFSVDPEGPGFLRGHGGGCLGGGRGGRECRTGNEQKPTKPVRAEPQTLHTAS